MLYNLGKKSILCVLSATMLLLLILAQAATFTVCEDGCDFASIQEAIDAAEAGDIIEVQSGTYYEYVDANKPLILRGVDTGAGRPVVDAGGSGSAITLSSDGVTLEGFRVTGSGGWSDGGIKVTSSNNTIRDNVAEENEYSGIVLSEAVNNTITANIVRLNAYGIQLVSSSNKNNITWNAARNNSDTGIYIRDSNDSLLYQNDLVNNTQYNAYDEDSNRWDNGKVGNHYSDIDCVDENKDGMCDSAYRILPGRQRVGRFSIDRHPLVSWTPFEAAAGVEEAVIETEEAAAGDEEAVLPVIQPAAEIKNATEKENITVCDSGCSYTSIQAAVNAASPGDRIEVRSGTYRENVNVTKPLTLHGVDTGSGQPVVDASGNGSAINVTSDRVLIEGFRVVNAGATLDDAGIRVTSNDSTLKDNLIEDNGGHGILLYESRNTSIMENEVLNNDVGIKLDSSRENLLRNNNVSRNSFGIGLIASDNNTLRNNLMYGNRYNFGASEENDIDTSNLVDGKPIYYLVNESETTVDSSSNAGLAFCLNCERVTIKDLQISNNAMGIYLVNTTNSRLENNLLINNSQGIQIETSDNNTISHNIVRDNDLSGIFLSASNNNTIDNNTALSNGANGLDIEASSNNAITGNNASSNSNGILLLSSGENLVSDNVARNNSEVGIALDNIEILELFLGDTTRGNVIRDNDASNNGRGGIFILDANRNTLYKNNLVNNSENNAYDESAYNEWDNGTVGNHYGGIDCQDADNNSICDSPYDIPGGDNVDRYPLALWP